MRFLSLVRSIFALSRTVPAAFTLLRDVRVPLRLKFIAVAAALFIISPLNALGDIPVLGFFDDAALIAMLLGWFVRAGSRYGAETSTQTLIASREPG